MHSSQQMSLLAARRRRRGLFGGRPWAVPAVALLLLSSTASTPKAGAEDEIVSVVGSFRIDPPPGGQATYHSSAYAFVEAASRRIYTVGPGWVSAYDADSFRPLGAGTVVTGRPSTAITLADGSLLATFVDGNALRLDLFTTRPAGVARIGSMALPTLVGQAARALYRAPGSPFVWLLADTPSVLVDAPVGVRVLQIDLRKLSSGGAPDWETTLSGCQRGAHANREFTNAALAYVKGSLYFGCTPMRNPSAPSALPAMPRGVGRLELTEPLGEAGRPGAFSLYPLPDNFAGSAGAASAFDPGSGRLAMIRAHPTGGTVVHVFDTLSGTYVGNVALGGYGDPPSIGLDPVAGRLYLAGRDNGLATTDIRATPPTQGGRDLRFRFDPRKPGAETHTPDETFGIPVDSAAGRLFLEFEFGNSAMVLRDNVPPYAAPAPRDPDENTADVDEIPGLTTFALSGAAVGYGADVRAVGGVDGLLQNSAGVDATTTPVASGTREVRTAYLGRLSLANDAAVASAIAAVPDEAETQSDLASTPAGADWPYRAASCNDFGEQPSAPASTGTVVSCNAANLLVSARTESRDTAVAVATLAGSELEASSRRDAKRGTVTRVTSTARGVSVLGGRLLVGSVEATAEAVAKGRPGTATATWSATVTNVVLDGVTLCTATCDPAAVAARVNGAGAGIRVDFPTPLRAATKGGYQAVVRREPFEHLEQIVLNEEPPVRIEVPAMVVSVPYDNARPGRFLLQFAAVGAEARYAITAPGAGFADGDSSSDLAMAELVSGSGTPLFGLGVPEGSSPAALPRELRPSLPRGRGLGFTLPTSWRLALSSLGRAAGVLPLWATLLVPVYLSARRWQLLQREALRRGSAA